MGPTICIDGHSFCHLTWLAPPWLCWWLISVPTEAHRCSLVNYYCNQVWFAIIFRDRSQPWVRIVVGTRPIDSWLDHFFSYGEISHISDWLYDISISVVNSSNLVCFLFMIMDSWSHHKILSSMIWVLPYDLFAISVYPKLDDLHVTNVHSLLLNCGRRLKCNAHLNDIVASPSANVASK